MRVIFSIRLVRSVFRRGHLGRFLLAAAVFVLNGAVIVYLFERHASGSNSFVTQAPSRARPAPPGKGARLEVTLAELDERLARIERLLTAIHPGSSPGAIDSG